MRYKLLAAYPPELSAASWHPYWRYILHDRRCTAQNLSCQVLALIMPAKITWIGSGPIPQRNPSQILFKPLKSMALNGVLWLI